MLSKIASIKGVNNESLKNAFIESKFKSFGILENHIIPLTNAPAQQESAAMLQGILDQFTTKKLNIKDLVLDVIKSKPKNMSDIAPEAKKNDIKDDNSSAISDFSDKSILGKRNH
jgi:hypothetical protein